MKVAIGETDYEALYFSNFPCLGVADSINVWLCRF